MQPWRYVRKKKRIYENYRVGFLHPGIMQIWLWKFWIITKTTIPVILDGKLGKISRNNSGKYLLYFEDNSTFTADIVVMTRLFPS